jgi:copper resistance protein B
MNGLSNAVNNRNTGMPRAIFLMALLMTMVLSPARAQNGAQTAEDGMQQDTMPDMGDMNMQGMDMSPAEGEASLPDPSQPAAVRDPHAYADGYDFGPIPHLRFADERRFASLLMDRLEWVRTSHHTVAAYDLLAWYGRDYDRAVLKAEGDVDGSSLQEVRTELLWGHAVASFWDTQFGVRYDNGVDPGRGWLAFGVQGLAPYWFGVDAAAYVRDAGHSALRLSADYELLLTQRLILQPRLEANFYGKRDAIRALGSGLSNLVVGMRLRFEIRREFAPYVGIEWTGKYGATADYARALGDAGDETRLVAGVRFWF